MTTTRRQVMLSAALLAAPKVAQTPEEQPVTALEDLMREHGVVARVLLVYDECASRLEKREPLPKGVVGGAAGLVKKFVEGYHEKIEEEHVFPRVGRKHQDLAATLRAQHAVGRACTSGILEKAAAPDAQVAQLLRRFVHIYRPHAAREDTVLFPAFREAVPTREYAKLGDQFEALEAKLVGHGGFERAVDEVAQLERELGIYELVK